jgi:dTMP kinase
MNQPANPCRGLLIVFEGLDGAGKTTQLGLLYDHILQQGQDVVRLREPTEGPWGQKLRQLMMHGRGGVTPATELEWFLNDRREHVDQRIRPALNRKQIVLLDRYYFSTMAYQGALGCDPQSIRVRNEAFAPPPDLLLLLDLPPAVGWQRLNQRGTPSHFERLDYLEQVAGIFDAMDFPYLRRIPADREPQAVQLQVRRETQQLLQRRCTDRGLT